MIGETLSARSSRVWLLERLDNILVKFFHEDGALTTKLDLDFEKRLELFELGLAYQITPTHIPKMQRDRYLGELYHAVGRHEEADSVMRKALAKFYDAKDDDELAELFWGLGLPLFESVSNYHEWLIRQELVTLHTRILEAKGRKGSALSKARTLLEKMKAFRYYEHYLNHSTYPLPGSSKIRWRWNRENEYWWSSEYQYALGLDLDARPSNSGVRVKKISYFSEVDIFNQAGVRVGDRIIELANQKIRHFADVEAIMFQFEDGDEIPVKIKRGSRTLRLTLPVKAGYTILPFDI